MGRVGIWEILLIAAVILLFFGAKRLPEIGAAIGRAIRELQQGLKGEKTDDPSAKKRE